MTGHALYTTRLQSLMSTILIPRTFTSSLIANATAFAEEQENIRKWEAVSGDRFNASMKKVPCVDKASKAARAFLQMLRMKLCRVTLQFLPHRAQYTAGVVVTPATATGRATTLRSIL